MTTSPVSVPASSTPSIDPRSEISEAASIDIVHSWDEFTALREVVVGTADRACLPEMSDISAWLACYPTMGWSDVRKISTGEFPARVIEETNEDLSTLCETLRAMGIVVHQPQAVNHARRFSSPDWTASGYISYCPRDITLVLGSTIIETASPMRSRYFELFNLRSLFGNYLRQGARWLGAPRPRLDDSLYDLDDDGLPVLLEGEPVFDAANVIRIGLDLFYQVSRSGNEFGMEWLRSVAELIDPRYQVHPIRDVYGYTHIDSTFAPLRPGLLLANPARVRADQIPAPLRQWDVIWCPPIEPTELAVPHTLSEPWISMNLLMVNSELAIADAAQPALLRLLESNGIAVVPLSLRHARVLGGGFHCVTLDIRRDGGAEEYFSG